MGYNFFMTTLKKRPTKTGVNFRKSTVLALLPVKKQLATGTFAEIADLVKLNQPNGQLDEDTLVCDLQLFFESPDFERQNLRLWRDDTGKLIGFGQLFISEQEQEIEGYLYFEVHPTQRSILETSILKWAEERMREVRKNRSLKIKLKTRSCDYRSKCDVLENQGFTIERHFLTMASSLNQSLNSTISKGFTLRNLSDESDLAAWVEMFNESFIDHWDYHPLTIGTVQTWLKNPHYKQELNWVAVSPEGKFAAFCVGYINYEENARTRINEGWIKLLGTRRGFRKLGLGRSILLNCLKQLQIEKIEQVKLGVDAESLTSATRLYEAVGFEQVNTWLSYVKLI